MRSPLARAAAGLAAVFAISGCATLHDTFSTSVDSKTVQQVHEAVPIGTAMDTADARLSSLGFDCDNRTGNFTDEMGRSRSAKSFLLCVRRSSQISLTCGNRDEVVVVPSGGVADEIDVSRGADCDQQPGPSLIAPNAAK
jgi:hypothetical protein